MTPAVAPPTGDFADLVAKRSIVVCCGSGGAGKTTASAAIALAGAQSGRRACVVTIDPARRLADALGVGELENTPRPIAGEWPGSLSALMLDAKSTFDELVARYSDSSEQEERILSNRLYRNLTSALSGTQEYMAAEKLYELNESGEFDLVVVDTPPARHALDFLDAPGRLTRFLENRIFRLLLMPGRASVKALSVASQALLRTISRVAGGEIVEDAIAFFRAFGGMEEGFRERAQRVEDLLANEGTAFVLVAAPRQDSVEEARYFSSRLDEARIPVAGLVMNRVHPDFEETGARNGSGQGRTEGRGDPAADRRGTTGRAEGGTQALDAGAGRSAQARRQLAELRRNLSELQAVARQERLYVHELAESVHGPVVSVPYLEEDVHDLAGLGVVASYLVGRLPRSTG